MHVVIQNEAQFCYDRLDKQALAACRARPSGWADKAWVLHLHRRLVGLLPLRQRLGNRSGNTNGNRQRRPALWQ